MKKHFGNCAGKQQTTYNGPTLDVTFCGVRKPGGRITVKARLNNPRRSREQVLQEVCDTATDRFGAKCKLIGWTTSPGTE